MSKYGDALLMIIGSSKARIEYWFKENELEIIQRCCLHEI